VICRLGDYARNQKKETVGSRNQERTTPNSTNSRFLRRREQKKVSLGEGKKPTQSSSGRVTLTKVERGNLKASAKDTKKAGGRGLREKKSEEKGTHIWKKLEREERNDPNTRTEKDKKPKKKEKAHKHQRQESALVERSRRRWDAGKNLLKKEKK